MSSGIRLLKKYRDGRGRWRRFPFYYTLLALSEAGGRVAAAEMRYAAPGLERLMRRRAGGDRYALRRRAVAERVLEAV